MNLIGGNGMPIQVLLVEDSPGDVRLTQEAFRDANPLVHLHVASDGVEAMDFLRHEGNHIGSPRPDLILLDLNLPKMDGREVLAAIKADGVLKGILRRAMNCRPTATSASPCSWRRLSCL
jgi:two-component system, chemotaxis family, response regulator Rcp1